jgi:hypothetical protein
MLSVTRLRSGGRYVAGGWISETIDGGQRRGPASLVGTLSPKARDDLGRVLIRDHADRDATASRLMRYRDENGQRWADVIDFLTMYPDARRRVARLLGEIEAGSY